MMTTFPVKTWLPEMHAQAQRGLSPHSMAGPGARAFLLPGRLVLGHVLGAVAPGAGDLPAGRFQGRAVGVHV